MFVFVTKSNILAQDSSTNWMVRIVEVDTVNFGNYFYDVRQRFGKAIMPNKAYTKASFERGYYQVDSFSGLEKLRYDIVSLGDTLKIFPVNGILTEGKQSYILMYQKDAFTWVFEERYIESKGTFYLRGEDAWSNDMWMLLERIELWTVTRK
jgi:hypothetical protein